VTGVALLPARPIVYASAAALLGAIALASRVPVRFLLRKLLLLEPFVLGVVAMTLFQSDGLHRFLVTLTRSTLCLAASILFAATTPFTDFLAVLRAWRLPPLLTATLALTYRYLFVLVDEALRMRRARAARTFARGRRPRWHALSTVVARLFVRVTARAERIHAAMSARGWQP
jgi:cobalt/nickel transport system permease protein